MNLDKKSKAYCDSVGDDCLCERTQPGTPVGECIYIFCGCNIDEAYQAGYKAAQEEYWMGYEKDSK